MHITTIGYDICKCYIILFLHTVYVVYDDACHLKKFATNKTRSTKTDTSIRIAKMHMVVDRFHFPGHVDAWCKKNCNPDDFDELKDVRKIHAYTV